MPELPPGVLEAFALYLVRTSALVLSSPLLGLSASFSGYKVALIFSLSLLLYAVDGGALPPETGTLAFGIMALREILIGLFLSFVLLLFLLAVRVAGELIGHEMGFAMARQIDPESGIQTPLVTRVYETFFLLALLAMDGHHWMIRALGESFARAPVGDVALGGGTIDLAQRLFSQMFAAGLTFAAPVMVLMVLVSILMGLLARVVPTLNVLEVGFSVRIAMALVAMFVFAPLMAPIMQELGTRLFSALDLATGSVASGA